MPLPIFAKLNVSALEREQVSFINLGKIEYKAAWDFQENLLQQNLALKAAARAANADYDVKSLPTKHYFILCEHPPVYTLGKSGNMGNVLISDEEMHARGISFFRTNRGGDITFHGPGQIVGYPILDLEKFKTDIGLYLRMLEQSIINLLAVYGIVGDRSKGETGVWLDPDKPGMERKICAMGVRCSRWVTMHGFALNVNTNLDYFSNIVPCGIQNKRVTSMSLEKGTDLPMNEVQAHLKDSFARVFDVELVEGASLSV